MTLSEEVEEIMREGAVSFNPNNQIVCMRADTAHVAIEKVCDACIQAIQDNPHKSPIEAITDMRRKQND